MADANGDACLLQNPKQALAGQNPTCLAGMDPATLRKRPLAFPIGALHQKTGGRIRVWECIRIGDREFITGSMALKWVTRKLVTRRASDLPMVGKMPDGALIVNKADRHLSTGDSSIFREDANVTGITSTAVSQIPWVVPVNCHPLPIFINRANRAALFLVSSLHFRSPLGKNRGDVRMRIRFRGNQT